MNHPLTHCFYCGNRALLRFIEGRYRHVCSVCELVLYHNPSPASAVLLVQQERVLLVKRALEPQQGYWALPAGFQEVGETPEQAARREMYEETGLVAGKLHLFDLVYNDHDALRPVNVAIFLTQQAEGQLTPGDDANEAAFFPLDQLPARLAFDYIPLCLEKLERPAISL